MFKSPNEKISEKSLKNVEKMLKNVKKSLENNEKIHKIYNELSRIDLQGDLNGKYRKIIKKPVKNH